MSTDPSAPYELWVSEDSTVLVRIWPRGAVEAATRPTPDHIWGAPVVLHEEKVR